MGNDESVQLRVPQVQTGFSTTNDSYHGISDYTPEASVSHHYPNDYYSIWSLREIAGNPPSQRLGHFTVYSSDEDVATIGYGTDGNDNYLSDFWILDLKKSEWRRILAQEQFPRTGSNAVLIDDSIWIYGGYSNQTYHADLHVLNYKTGEIHRPPTNGDLPPPLTGFSMGFVNNSILIFGGYNGNSNSKLYSLNVSTLTWSMIETSHVRIGSSFATHENSLYVIAGSSTPGMLQVTENLDVRTLEGLGRIPSSTIKHSSCVGFDNYLLLVGGEDVKSDNNSYNAIYCFDINSHNWFLFNILPDSYTTNFCDGQVDDDGHFLLPKCKGSSIIYRETKKEIVLFFGKPFGSSPILYVIDVNNALCALHLHADMKEMFYLTGI